MKSLVTARGNPYLTMIWLSILGSGLFFFFLLFVFFTKVQSPDWKNFFMPPAFFYSTAAMLLSSVSLQFAKRFFRLEMYAQYFQWLALTGILALAFCLLQVAGWRSLLRSGLDFNMVSGAFVYILTGFHLLHILLGMAGLAWATFQAYKNRHYVDGYILSLNPFKTSFLLILSIFWHFLGLLWLVLFFCLWSQT